MEMSMLLICTYIWVVGEVPGSLTPLHTDVDEVNYYPRAQASRVM